MKNSMIDLVQKLRENNLVLAPMAGITDTVFRTLMRELGAGIVISELISARGMLEGGRKTWDLCRFQECERPVGIQLFGEDPAVLGRAAAEVEKMGADFVDLNLGCPVPKVVKKGGGAAMLKDPKRLEGVLKEIRSYISIPLTIKIRTGWDSNSITAIDCIKAAAEGGATWVSIHGRTREQAYTGKADWELIARCKEASSLPIIGNGDIATAEQALERLQQSGCDGVMIGRGTLRNPWIFLQALALRKNTTHEVKTHDFLDLLRGHKKLLDQFPDYYNPSLHLRKFAAWYSHGYPDSAAFRRDIFQAKELSHIEDLYSEFFTRIQHVPLSAKSVDSFFTSGHG